MLTTLSELPQAGGDGTANAVSLFPSPMAHAAKLNCVDREVVFQLRCIEIGEPIELIGSVSWPIHCCDTYVRAI